MPTAPPELKFKGCMGKNPLEKKTGTGNVTDSIPGSEERRSASDESAGTESGAVERGRG